MRQDSKLAKVYPWIVVALLWVVALLNYMDRQMLSTMRDSMQIDISELESAVNFGRLMAIFLSSRPRQQKMADCWFSWSMVNCDFAYGILHNLQSGVLAKSIDGRE